MLNPGDARAVAAAPPLLPQQVKVKPQVLGRPTLQSFFGAGEGDELPRAVFTHLSIYLRINKHYETRREGAAGRQRGSEGRERGGSGGTEGRLH